MKISEIFENVSDKKLFLIAQSAGNKLYGQSHSGLILTNNVTHQLYADYIQNSDTANVDTYDYIFFPSTGKGLEAADSPFDSTMVDIDDKIYLAGSNGIFVLSEPFKNNSSVKVFPDDDFQIFKRTVLKHFSDSTFSELDKFDRIFAHSGAHMIGQFLVRKDFGQTGLNKPAWLVYNPNGKTIKKMNW
jgi:hypothetical protein